MKNLYFNGIETSPSDLMDANELLRQSRINQKAKPFLKGTEITSDQIVRSYFIGGFEFYEYQTIVHKFLNEVFESPVKEIRIVFQKSNITL
jgi:hypothetical protein